MSCRLRWHLEGLLLKTMLPMRFWLGFGGLGAEHLFLQAWVEFHGLDASIFDNVSAGSRLNSLISLEFGSFSQAWRGIV